MSDQLKPCPFCGGDAVVEKSLITLKYRIACKNCGVSNDWLGQVMDCPTPPERRRMDAWNTRADAAPRVKPLDLSNLLKYAFLSGFVAAKDLPAHEPYNGNDHWPDFGPEPCSSYARILSALEGQP